MNDKRPVLKITIIIVSILIVAAAIITLGMCLNKRNKNETVPPTESVSETETPTEPETETETESETEPENVQVSVIDGSIMHAVKIDEEKWYLTLINRHYFLEDDFTCETADLKGGYTLDARAAEWYNKMYDAAANEGVDLTVCSGYRSVTRQRELYEARVQRCINEDGLSYDDAKKAAAEWVLPPGTSEHNLGLCADIGWVTEDFENSSAFRWLCENAEDYGFILRYPEDKEDITEVNYEPWHWRYVGIEDAKKMNELGVCLEEYVGKVN